MTGGMEQAVRRTPEGVLTIDGEFGYLPRRNGGGWYLYWCQYSETWGWQEGARVAEGTETRREVEEEAERRLRARSAGATETRIAEGDRG